MIKRASGWLQAADRPAWVLLWILLPVTSLPLLVRLTGADMVAPAAALPLLWLLLAWLVPYTLRKGRFSKVVLPLLGFILVALAACTAAFWTEIPSFKDRSILGRERQALITLGVGVSFYLVCSVWPRSNRRLQFTLQLINWSGLLIILWALAQVAIWASG